MVALSRFVSTCANQSIRNSTRHPSRNIVLRLMLGKKGLQMSTLASRQCTRHTLSCTTGSYSSAYEDEIIPNETYNLLVVIRYIFTKIGKILQPSEMSLCPPSAKHVTPQRLLNLNLVVNKEFWGPKGDH